jgi:hypothetical protein
MAGPETVLTGHGQTERPFPAAVGHVLGWNWLLLVHPDAILCRLLDPEKKG